MHGGFTLIDHIGVLVEWYLLVHCTCMWVKFEILKL